MTLANSGRTAFFYCAVIGVLMLGVGCVTTKTESSLTTQKDELRPLTGGQYTLFWDQGDHLRELVNDRKFSEAAELYGKERRYFDQRSGKYDAELREAADFISAESQPQLTAALHSVKSLTWPVPRSAWATVKSALSSADEVIARYKANPLLADGRFASSTFVELNETTAALTHRIAQGAAQDFAAFDHFGGASFFDEYPAKLDAGPFLAAQRDPLRPKLQAARPKALEAFAESYLKDGKADDATHRAVADAYVAAVLKEGDGGLASAITALKRAAAVGLKLEGGGLARLGFVEATSKSLLRGGHIEFPAAIEVDMPIQPVKAGLDAALTDTAAGRLDYLIVFEVALAKATRRVGKVDKQKSRAIVEFREIPNPNYEMMRLHVMRAQSNLTSSEIQGAVSTGLMALGHLIGTIAARSRLDEAMLQLQNTPMTIQDPVYRDYQFDKAQVSAAKTLTVNYYVIDRRRNAYFKSTFDVVERRSFAIAYNLHKDDTNRSRHLSELETEEALKNWEEAATSVKLSQLLDHYLANQAKLQRLPSLEALRAELARDKNVAIAKVRENTFTGSTRHDARFDSVVAIYVSGRKGLGTGFFVTPDIVMTNYHVVENANFVEMKMWGGRETFGKVLNYDARLDLALIRVQERGRPVKFFGKNELELGATIEVIGHPHGLEFSITRGVTSAVRKMPNKAILPGAGDVLLVQSDAAVNRGNSGGPWFVNNEVVAVTSWGFSSANAQNINFGIHYSEAQRFLKESLERSE